MSMETAFFADLNMIADIKFQCLLCDWSGCESELAMISSRDSAMTLACCPQCKNDDIRVINE
jgi:hypothetical protein